MNLRYYFLPVFCLVRERKIDYEQMAFEVESTRGEVNLLKYFAVVAEDGKATPKTISPGSALLSALLKQPLVSGSPLGLCHLLSSNAEALPGAVLQPDLLET